MYLTSPRLTPIASRAGRGEAKDLLVIAPGVHKRQFGRFSAGGCTERRAAGEWCHSDHDVLWSGDVGGGGVRVEAVTNASPAENAAVRDVSLSKSGTASQLRLVAKIVWYGPRPAGKYKSSFSANNCRETTSAEKCSALDRSDFSERRGRRRDRARQSNGRCGGDYQERGTDAIAADNVLRVPADGRTGSAALLISPLTPRGSAPLGLERIHGLDVSAMTPGEFASLSVEELERFSLYLFHRSSPARTLAHHHYFYCRPKGIRPFPSAARKIRLGSLRGTRATPSPPILTSHCSLLHRQ